MAVDNDIFLPDFCRARPLLAAIVSAILLSLLLTLAAGVAPAEFWTELARRLLLVNWIVLVSVAALCVLRRHLRPLGHSVAGLITWGIIVLVAALTTELAWRYTAPQFATPHEHHLFLVNGIGISAVAAALVLRYLFDQYRQHQHELAEAKARYVALQARIRPHFLFNGLNTVLALVRRQPELAETLLQDMADLFRASMRDTEMHTTLADELALAQGYLRIEQQRLGERLSVNWDLRDLPDTLDMPVLVIQPLLENAVYHGIEPRADGGEIRITGRHQGGRVRLCISNPLPPGDARPRPGNRMAVENIRARLAATYGDLGQLTGASRDGRYVVELGFPTQRPEPR